MELLEYLIIQTIICSILGVNLISNDNLFLKMIGGFSMLAACGGILWLGFLASVIVWHHVSEHTFSLLGIIVAAPLLLGPVYLIIYMLGLSKKTREYNGRDSDGDDGGY